MNIENTPEFEYVTSQRDEARAELAAAQKRVAVLEDLLASARAHITNLSTALVWTKTITIAPSDFDRAMCQDAGTLRTMIDAALAVSAGAKEKE